MSFNVNIFGTTHYPGSTTPPNGSFRFNLHVLQVETTLTPLTFDMFIEFYAFPFNSLGAGTSVIAGVGTQPMLSDRYDVEQPQIIHIDQLTPGIGSAIYLANCTPFPIVEPGFPTPPCSPSQLTLPSCPLPNDFRLFSHPFQVKTKLTSSSSTFDRDWSNITNSLGNNSLIGESSSQFYLLPIKIVIISDGCRYEKIGNIRIFNNYILDNSVGSDSLNGNPRCWQNPNYYPLGEFDKILVG